MRAAIEEMRLVWRLFFLEVTTAMRIPQLLEWMIARIEKMRR